MAIVLEQEINTIEKLIRDNRQLSITISLNECSEWNVQYFIDNKSIWHHIGLSCEPLQYVLFDSRISYLEKMEMLND